VRNVTKQSQADDPWVIRSVVFADSFPGITSPALRRTE
jgi:hypothetical protein